MPTNRTFALAALGALILALGPTLTALAHPLGNFTVNQYSRIELSPVRITLRYIVDMAEIPTFQESALIDLNHDGQLDASEGAAYLKIKAEQLRQGLSLQVDGQALPLAISSEAISFPAGQGGLPTTRMVIDLAAPAAGASGSHSLVYHDDNYADRLGWREIIVRGAGVALAQASAPATDRSAELTAYPADMLTSPLDVREARATFALGTAATAPGAVDAGSPGANILDRSRDELAALIATEELSLPVVLLALAAAAGLGALHSLSPGHGKTVVGAYLVGSRGTARHALFLGLTVTLTHTSGVFALGLVTLFASQFILPERLYPWLSLLSGLFVALIGVSLFITRLRSFLRARAAGRADAAASTRAAAQSGLGPRVVPVPALALAGGGERAHDGSLQAAKHQVRFSHAHEHDAGARAGGQQHAFSHEHMHDAGAHTGDHEHAFSHHGDEDGQLHSHAGGRPHSHLPVDAQGNVIDRVSWRNLLALGVSGGLLPCPSALVVLLAAISLQRVAFGLLLIVAFSAGLAGVLTGIGLLLVVAGRQLERVRAPGALVRLLPAGSALVVTVLGSLILIEALGQIGLLR